MILLDKIAEIEQHEGIEASTMDGYTQFANRGYVTTIPHKSLETMSVDDAVAFIVGERSPQQLQHMTRVVGYYSQVSNFNPSKVGELRDRQKGSYALEESNDATG